MTRIRKASLILAVSIVLISSRALAQTEEANNILGQAGSGVVTIIGYGSDKAEILKGTAFALSEDVVVTAYHAVSQAFDVEGLNIKGKKVKIEGLMGVDKARDLALLKLKGKVQALPIGSVDRLEPGARLFALGANESGQVIIAEGTYRKTVDAGAAGKLLEISLSVPEQFRGGPLLDLNGQLVGMLLVLERNLKFGVPIGTVVGVPRGDKVVAFKSQAQESFFETVGGNAFAAGAAVALDDLLTARVHLERAVKIEPGNLGAQVLLADIYAKQRDYAAAVSAYRKAAQLDPTRADAYYGMGSTLLKQTQYKDAAEALEKAAALGYPDKMVYFELGSAHEAVQHLEVSGDDHAILLGEKCLTLKRSEVERIAAVRGVSPADVQAVAEVEVQAGGRDVHEPPDAVRQAGVGDVLGAEHVGLEEGLVGAPGRGERSGRCRRPRRRPRRTSPCRARPRPCPPGGRSTRPRPCSRRCRRPWPCRA